MQLAASAPVVALRALLVSVVIHALVIWGLGFAPPSPAPNSPPVVNFEISAWGVLESGLADPSPLAEGIEDAPPFSLPRSDGSEHSFDDDRGDAWDRQAQDEDSPTPARRRPLVSDLPEEELRRLLGGSRARIARRLRANSDLDTPATRYLNRWQRSVESAAALHLPLDMGSVRGALTVRAVIDAEGRLLEAQILEPSANARLNELALEVLRAASPFARFQDALRRHADEVEVVRRWHFLGDAASGPHLQAPVEVLAAPRSV